MKISQRAAALSTRARASRLAVGAATVLALAMVAGCLEPNPNAGPSVTGSTGSTTGSPAPTSPAPTATSAPPTTPPVTTPPSALFGEDFTRIPTSAKVVALTFDAGANADA